MFNKSFKILLIYISISFLSKVNAQTNNILMFIAHEDVYYSEYIVMKEALEASGYTVDVRSASIDISSTYMAASQIDIEITANALSGSTYTQFINQFEEQFSSTWNPLKNSIPIAGLPVNGRIQDVADMSLYDALIVVGGTGALAYRVDNSYENQGSLSAIEVQSAAEKLNQLALEALSNDKPVMAQCHGASIPAFWRIPGTSGPNEESIGFSLVKDGYVTGYPFPSSLLTEYTTNLNINSKAQDRVTLTSPHSSFYDIYGATPNSGASKIITTRDWYPQTISYAAKTIINILQSYPQNSVLNADISTLIIHGGEVDCSPNSGSDIPCNHGNTGNNIPADFLNIALLLQEDSINDDFNFILSDVNILDTVLPFDQSNINSISSYLSQFDSIIFFKHWSSGITLELQQAIVNYADNGGTVIGLHHAAFNHIVSTQVNKNLLVELFGVQSTLTGWSGTILGPQTLSIAQLGHFITSYGTASIMNSIPSPTNGFEIGANNSFSYQHSFSIFDEIYNNWELVAGQNFGTGINQLTPLLKNNITSSAGVLQQNFAGLVKQYDGNLDGTVGRIVFMMSGERVESININHPYGQLIRNSVAWINPSIAQNQAPIITSNNTASVIENQTMVMTVTASDADGDTLSFALTGITDDHLFSISTSGVLTFNTAPIFDLDNNLYFLTVTVSDQQNPPLQASSSITVNVIEEALFINGFEEK